MEKPTKPSLCFWCPPEQKAGASSAYILLHANSYRWVLVNETFRHIASLLDKGISADEVAASISAQFSIPLQSARRDVDYAVDTLTEQGFFSSLPQDVPLRGSTLSDLFIHVTDRCNLSCPHCYYPSASFGDMAPGLVRRMIDEAIDLGGKTITFSGGEPLLHPHIKTLLQYASRKLGVRLLTNGTLLDREWASFLAGVGDVQVQVSIDGSRKEIHDPIRGSGTFSKVIEAVDHLQKAGLGEKINFSTTVMKQNLHDLCEIIRLAGKMGVPSARFLPLRKEGRAKNLWEALGTDVATEDYETFYDEVRGIGQSKSTSVQISCGLSGFMLNLLDEISRDDIWCPVGKKIVVATNGDIFPCVLMMREEFKLGNVFYKNLSEIMKSLEMSRVCKELTERKTKIEKCFLCDWRNFCQAGCMGQALDEKGTIWDTDRFCEYRQKLYQKTFQTLLKQFTSHSKKEGDDHTEISDIEPECNPIL